MAFKVKAFLPDGSVVEETEADYLDAECAALDLVCTPRGGVAWIDGPEWAVRVTFERMPLDSSGVRGRGAPRAGCAVTGSGTPN